MKPLPNFFWKAGRIFLFLTLFISFLLPLSQALAEITLPQTDQTPISPLAIPGSPARPRYISGFGLDNAYTVFYEDRNDQAGCSNLETYRIYFNQTTSGPLGFAPASTKTDICDTHFIVKRWPITVGAATYSYRGWGAQGNNPNHAFYVSNNLVNWTQIYLGTGMFSDPGGVLAGDSILYGFHDIVKLNNNYIGFVESAGGRTYIAWSDNGDQNWTIKAQVGGAVAGAGPLNLYFFAGIGGPIPTGNFVVMQTSGQTVYGKLMIPSDRSGAYLAINRAAAQAATPALAETAFLNPANWTWRDGTTGLPGASNRALTGTFSTGGHTIQEAWVTPLSNPVQDPVTLYTANYASGARGVGCAAANSQCRVIVILPPTPPPPPTPISPQEPGGFIPVTGFAPRTITQLELQPEEQAYSASNILLEIPSLGVQVEVVGVPLVNGKWDVSWLGDQAGYLQGTAFPTLPGNSAITGHIYNSEGKPGPFIGLYRLQYGDEIRLHAWGNLYVYEVRENKLVQPDDRSAFQHETYTWITLLTCQGYDPSTNTYRWRRMVRAVLTSLAPEP
ncbi:MAG: serine/threonine protein kinase [Anaerolineaceae bacterium]|nr:MAG: serine/threonine protein kinase [Anaerolineaceae bacterium]